MPIQRKNLFLTWGIRIKLPRHNLYRIIQISIECIVTATPDTSFKQKEP